MSCSGRGICGCGAPLCIDAAWFSFCGIWILVAFELGERQLDAFTDDEIDYEREMRA